MIIIRLIFACIFSVNILVHLVYEVWWGMGVELKVQGLSIIHEALGSVPSTS